MSRIELRDHRGVVTGLLVRALDRLDHEEPDFRVGCVALFSNPCEGSLSVCFDRRTLDEMDDLERNCAEFDRDFFEDGRVEAWREAYWCDDPTVEIVTEAGETVVLHDRANERFDEPIFRFLQAELARLVPDLARRRNVACEGLTLGVQLHDSALVRYWLAGDTAHEGR